MKRSKLFAWLSAALVAATVLAACAPAATPAATQAPQPTAAADNTAAPAPTDAPADAATDMPAEPTAEAQPASQVVLPDINPADYEGDIIIAGSSTVFPLTERMAEIFREDGYADNLTIDSVGTGGGFERFCETGESDIANASRPINEGEVANCEAIGRTPIEFRVGTDALAIVVSAENDWLEGVTVAELAAIYSSDATLWSDVSPAWPAETILRFSPGTDSGTYDYFLEAVMEEVYGDEGEPKLLEAGSLQLSEDDNVLVQGVEGSPYAIAYFGYAYYQENASALKLLTIDGVEATAATTETGAYPLARPLFIYSDARIMQEKSQVGAFINYYLTYVNDEIVDVGYFPASVAALDTAKQALLDGLNTAAVVLLPDVDPSAVSGDIIAAGSSTVFPLTERMAEIFRADGYTGNLTIDSVGTGGGFERFCETGESDIANASRAINEGEVANCEAIGRTPIEFRVGTDALAIVVSAENDWLEGVTVAELATIYSSDATLWSDVNPAWPAETILRFSPGTDSGTYDYFLEAVMEEVYGDEGEPKLLEAGSLQLSEDDNVLVQGVEGSPYAIAYFGYAYYQENASALKLLTIDGVEATAETTETGAYPLARPLFIYSDARIMQEKSQVGAFINYYLTYVNDEIVDVGYFPASVAALDTAKQALLDGLNTAAVVLLPDVDPSAVSGDIIAAGSSTVFPLTERMAEIFRADGYTGNLTIDSVGTGGGFERFCETGESDIANASRAINEGEVANCEAIGRTPIEFRVGTDALAIVVSAENDWLEGVTVAELAAIYSSDATLWSDVNPAWPAETILRFSPGTDSGTYDYFLEAVMEEVYGDEAEPKLLEAANLQLSEDDNVLVQGVEGSPYAIAYFGYAYYQENAGALKLLTIDAVEATVASVDAGEYPLARPLFIYSDATILQEKPQVAAFINYYLTYVDDEIRDVGYFPANSAALDAARTAWLEATGAAAQ